MNREEYEELKKELVFKRKSIDDELNNLSRTYYDGLFTDAKDKFEGKYSIIFSESSLTKFSIYRIKKVVYANDSMVEFVGDKWSVNYDFGEEGFHNRCNIDYENDSRLSVYKSYLRISSKDECKKLLDAAKFYNQAIFDKFE